MKQHSVVVSILKKGKASKAIKVLKDVGVVGGTIVYGSGTADSEILKFLEYTNIKKEILFSVVDTEQEVKALQALNDKFELEKVNRGIAFSIPLTDVISSSNQTLKVKQEELANMSYEVIFVVVDNHRGEEVVSIAEKYGSKGATIIHGRGSGIEDQGSIFNIVIEPEKEIVMMLVKSDKHDEIVAGLTKDLNITEPGHGIIFSANVNQAVGLVE